jgi:hypothetical protein
MVEMIKVLFILVIVSLFLPQVYAGIAVSELGSLGAEPTAICAVDFNRDGVPDTAVIGTVSKAIAYGSYTWEISVSGVNAITPADLDGDGYLNEVIIAGKDVVAVDSGGGEIWRIPSLRGYSACAADLDGDGYKNEVVVGAWNRISALDDSGNLLWNYTKVTGNVNSIAATDRYVVAGVRRTLLALDFYGNLRWSKVLPENVAAVAPIDSDSTGKMDGIIAVSYDGDSKRAYARAFSMYGADKGWKFERYYEGKIGISIYPLDKYSRGKLDHAAFNLDDGIFWVTSKGTAGSITGVWRMGFGPADFDGDGIADDIIAGKDATERKAGEIHAISAYGVVLATSNTSGGSKIVAVDFNFDGIANDAIAVSSFDRRVYSVIALVSDETTSTAPQTTQPPATTAPPQTTQPPTTTAPPQPMKISVDLGADKTITEGEDITLSPTAIPSTADGKIVSYVWTEEGKFLGDTPSITLSLTEGTHNISVKVTDDTGASSTDSVIITVNPSEEVSADSDGDGWTDAFEIEMGTDPNNPDTDGDGIIDSKDPNPLVSNGKEGLPSLGWLEPVLGILKWGILLAVGIFIIIYIREKILDFLWERRQDWGE